MLIESSTSIMGGVDWLQNVNKLVILSTVYVYTYTLYVIFITHPLALWPTYSVYFRSFCMQQF